MYVVVIGHLLRLRVSLKDTRYLPTLLLQYFLVLNSTSQRWHLAPFRLTPSCSLHYALPPFHYVPGLLLFTVILLIGTGWSLVKPYLNDREKKIVLVVLILQVIDNVALIVLEEMAPGSQVTMCGAVWCGVVWCGVVCGVVPCVAVLRCCIALLSSLTLTLTLL